MVEMVVGGSLWTLTQPGARGCVLRVDGFQWDLRSVGHFQELSLTDKLSHGQPKHTSE